MHIDINPMRESSPLHLERGRGRGKNTKHFAKNYTSTLRKEGFPLLLERACPENREAGGEVEITLKSQNFMK